MKGKVLLGILVLVVGLITAIYGVARMSDSDQGRGEAAIVGDQNESDREEVASTLIPVVAGVSIAAGAALIGIGMGAFRRPKIVPPDSPEASKATTTRGTTS
jgi:cadmium resistance protein CadD (predicted permease)